MHRLLIALSITLLHYVPLSAQLIKGTISPGGTASLNLLFDSENNLTTVLLEPSFGYFISDQIMIGSSISVATSFTEGSSGGYFGIGPFVRYYLSSTEYPTQWYLGVHTQFAGNRSDGQSETGASIYPQIGLSSFFNASIALDLRLGPNFVLSDGRSTLNLLGQAGFRIFIDPDLFAARASSVSNFTAGSLVVGGSRIRVNYNPGDGGEIFAAFNPNVGVFLGPTSSLGVRAGFDYRKDRFSPFKVVNYRFLPFFRQYISTGHLAWFAEVGGGISGFNITGSTVFDNLSESGFQAQVGIGNNLFITENAAIEMALNYSYDAFQELNRLGLDFGFQYFLR